jgi:FkbM family methyltransferase
MLKEIVRKVRNKYFPSEQQKEVKKYFADGGDAKYRYGYPLTPDSIVFDLGGYMGEFASKLFSMYLCKIYVFEPVTAYSKIIKDQFIKNPKIIVNNFGLGGRTRMELISINNDGSSIYIKSEQREEILIKSIGEFIHNEQIETIDLMKINIEGGEYELLSNLIETGLIKNINNIQIQFHKISDNSDWEMKSIQDNLRNTHTLTFQFKYVWENWLRNS